MQDLIIIILKVLAAYRLLDLEDTNTMSVWDRGDHSASTLLDRLRSVALRFVVLNSNFDISHK